MLIFERDPEGYSFTPTLGLRALKDRAGKVANASPAIQAFSWQPVASPVTMQAVYCSGNNNSLWKARSAVYILIK